MYESHFGFHRQPFQCADLARSFLVSESIRGILPQLLHALRSDLGIAVLTGPSGAGKSSVLRHLQSLLSHDGRILVCSGASLETTADVLLALQTASQLKTGESASTESPDGCSPPSRWTVVEQMRKTIEFWGPILLLIDDAQLLSVPILNELRAFTEEEWNGRGLVRILVSGPLSFEDDLARPACSDFSRRIRCHAFLQPLTAKESTEFLSRHLEAAGGRLSEVFTSAALELVVSACDGLPRCLSLLADESLVVAAELSKKKTDNDCVQEALTRLQHLPYAWSASPIRSHETSLVDHELSEHFDKPTAIPSILQPAVPVPVSPGVIEFGAPGVIEFGAPSVIEFGDGPVDSPINSRDMNSTSDDDFGDTAATWTPLESHFEPAHSTENSIESTIRATSCTTFIGNEATEDGYAMLAADEPVSRSVASGDSNSEIAYHACWERTPVFDRYTWIALGRDVADVSRSSAVTMPLANTGDLISEIWNSTSSNEPVAAATRNMIQVTRTSDQEICRLLSCDESEFRSGAFFAFRSSAPITQLSQEVWGNESWEEEDYATESSAEAEEMEGTVESESSWQDGQLIFRSETSIPEDVLRGVDTGESAMSGTDTEQVSFSIEAARSARTEVDQPANDVIENDHRESEANEPKREMFFTLPVDVRSIEWDLRTELADPDGVFPLAESLASLRDEVTSFQKNIRIDYHTNADGPETLTEGCSSPDLIEDCGGAAGCDNLVARAKRQLERLPTYRPADVQVIADHRTFVSVIDHRKSSLTAEELPSAAVQTDNGLPNFGQLFTRLRQKRQQAVENDSR